MAARWRLARSLEVLRSELNAAHPARRRTADGTIGDTAHSKRGRLSDHNPWLRAGRLGVVTAIDVDDDGGRLDYLAEHLRQLGKAGDPRVKYVISDGRIASRTAGWAWRPYRGPNKHLTHTHLSVVPDLRHADSSAPWGVAPAPGGTRAATVHIAAPAPVGGLDVAQLPTLRRGDGRSNGRGKLVGAVQGALAECGLYSGKIDGDYGPKTEAAVRRAQQLNRLECDGVIGPATWPSTLGV